MDYLVKRLENLEREECRIAQIKLVATKCRMNLIKVFHRKKR